MAKYTKTTVQYPDGTVKTTESVQESGIEEVANAVSKTFDNGVKTLTGQPINNAPR